MNFAKILIIPTIFLVLTICSSVSVNASAASTSDIDVVDTTPTRGPTKVQILGGRLIEKIVEIQRSGALPSDFMDSSSEDAMLKSFEKIISRFIEMNKEISSLRGLLASRRHAGAGVEATDDAKA